MANNYISLKIVVDKVMRHPMMSNISYETIIDYTIDFMRIVKCVGFFEEKITTVEIENYKGKLPVDMFEINQVKYNDICLIYSTDSFHLQQNVQQNTCERLQPSYKIQGGYIFTSVPKGELTISYQAILTDEDGYPMIPDNSKFTRALEAYIKKEWFGILFDLGKLQPAIYQNAQQSYAWAVGACETEFQHLTLDKAEAFYNSWRTMLIRNNEHSRGFRLNGQRQNLKID